MREGAEAVPEPHVCGTGAAAFKDEIAQLVLVPRTGGIFEIRADDDLLWSRRERGRFPELKELKQLIRDRIAPGKDLGHSDRRDS